MAVTDLRRVGPRSHIETPAWQSFEMKMRARAAQHRAAKRRRRLRAVAATVAFSVAAAAGWWRAADIARRSARIDMPPAPVAPRPIVVAAARPLPPVFEPPDVVAPQAETAPVPTEPPVGVPPVEARTPVGTSLRPGTMTAGSGASADVEPVATPLVEPASAVPASEPPPVVPVDTAAPPPRATVVSAAGATASPSPDAPAAYEAGRARESVRDAIERYRRAYERLDAAAAQSVWPAVDAGALSRAFGALESQQLAFDQCDIQIAESRASATCRGRARVVPKVGGGVESVQRTWRFSLAQSGDRWTIASATVR